MNTTTLVAAFVVVVIDERLPVLWDLARALRATPLRSGILVFFAVLARGGAAVLRLCGATASPAFAATRDEGDASAAARAALATLPFALTGVGRVRGRRWVVLAMRDGRRRRTGPALCLSPGGGACSA